MWKLQGYENYGSQLDGAKLELFKKLNKIGKIRKKVDIATQAEEHAEQLNQLAEDLKQWVGSKLNAEDCTAHISNKKDADINTPFWVLQSAS